MSEKRPPHPPTLKECERGFWVASYAEQLVEELIEKGKPTADNFVSLCSALRDLKIVMMDASEFDERAIDLHDLMNWKAAEAEAKP